MIRSHRDLPTSADRLEDLIGADPVAETRMPIDVLQYLLSSDETNNPCSVGKIVRAVVRTAWDMQRSGVNGSDLLGLDRERHPTYVDTAVINAIVSGDVQARGIGTISLSALSRVQLITADPNDLVFMPSPENPTKLP